MAAGSPWEFDGQGMVARGARRSTSREGATCLVPGTREDAVHARQEDHTARVADLVVLPPTLATTVLRHFRWRAKVIEGRCFTDG